MAKAKTSGEALGTEQENSVQVYSEGIMERGQYIRSKIEQEFDSKRAIAEFVADKYVEDLDAVLLDAGSTAEMIAQELFARRRFLTLMTNNMGAYAAYTRAVAIRAAKVAGEAKESQFGIGHLNENELLLTGGRFDVTYEALFGDETVEAIKKFSPNVTIIAVSGFRLKEGVFCHGSEEVRIKSLLWQKQTDTRLIAADWTKIGKRDAYSFGPSIDDIITGANKAVIVTSPPPRNSNASIRKRFDDQIRQLEKKNIIIEMVRQPEVK